MEGHGASTEDMNALTFRQCMPEINDASVRLVRLQPFVQRTGVEANDAVLAVALQAVEHRDPRDRRRVGEYLRRGQIGGRLVPTSWQSGLVRRSEPPNRQGAALLNQGIGFLNHSITSKTVSGVRLEFARRRWK